MQPYRPERNLISTDNKVLYLWFWWLHLMPKWLLAKKKPKKQCAVCDRRFCSQFRGWVRVSTWTSAQTCWSKDLLKAQFEIPWGADKNIHDLEIKDTSLLGCWWGRVTGASWDSTHKHPHTHTHANPGLVDSTHTCCISVGQVKKSTRLSCTNPHFLISTCINAKCCCQDLKAHHWWREWSNSNIRYS